MLSANNNHWPNPKIPHHKLQSLAILTLSLICTSSSTLFAQSGRKETQSQAPTTATKEAQAGRPGNDRQASPPSFIVVTASPDRFHDGGAPAPYFGSTNLEYQARGGCLLELKNIPGVKVAEDEDVARWEAREIALAGDKTWVIWMELKWDKATSAYDPTPFRLRYLLFEPGTGRIKSSGVGKGVKQTWGKSQTRSISLDEQLRQAGRDIADQVLSEITTAR